VAVLRTGRARTILRSPAVEVEPVMMLQGSTAGEEEEAEDDGAPAEPVPKGAGAAAAAEPAALAAEPAASLSKPPAKPAPGGHCRRANTSAADK
jgi:hypothetical protein